MRKVVPLLLVLLAACARTDLGAPCHLMDGQGAEIQPQAGREYLFLGSSECGSFACLAPTGTGQGYCSQPCSGKDGACPQGMVCGQLAIDASYLATLKARLPPAQFDALFSQLGGTFYCQKP